MVILDLPDSKSVAASSASMESMLKSCYGSKYLNPNYINPTHNESDAKSSPLAMLAKTCSQIGSDDNLPNKQRQKAKPSEHLNASNLSSSPNPSSPLIPKSPGIEKPTSSGASCSSSTSSLSPVSTNYSKVANTSPSAKQRPSSTTSDTSTPPKTAASSSTSFARTPATSTKSPAKASTEPCQDPMCRDATCPTFIRNQQLLAAASGNFSLPLGSGSLPSPLNPFNPLLMQQREALVQAQILASSMAVPERLSPLSPGGTYTCSWVSGSEYCGRRFTNSEDLLLHLKTHAILPGGSADPRNMALLNSTATSLDPRLSAMSARFHPYARPGGISSPPSLGILPSPPSSLGYLHSYASLYPSLFSRSTLL